MASKPRQFCPHGHVYTGENTMWRIHYYTGTWYKVCKACHRLRSAKSYAKSARLRRKRLKLDT